MWSIFIKDKLEERCENRMKKEGLLNTYYNKGEFNHPARIGYMIKTIRQLSPLTEDEWRIWYLKNIHDDSYLTGLAEEMCGTIPPQYHIGVDECKDYIYDVMFRRTFQGYNKEKSALRILRQEVSPDVQEAPEDWDTQYFIDFYVKGADNRLVGIQLKPETFYHGQYQNIVDIEGKMGAFRQKYNAATFILTYRQSSEKEIVFCDPGVIKKIKELVI